MPVIVGSPRSGTTLLRLMLDAHPGLAIPPETGFLSVAKQLADGADLRERFFQTVVAYPPEAPAWNDFHIPAEAFHQQLEEIRPFSLPDGIRLFYKMYASRFGKPRWGDKTPMYCHHLLEIQELLPEAHFIHLIRDGRDVAVSLREQWFSPGHEIATQAKYWRDNVLAAHTQGSQCAHYLEAHYEDLIRDPESALRRICDFIQMDFHPAMLAYHEHAPQRLQEHLERRRTDGSLVVSQAARRKQQVNATRPPDAARIEAWRELLSPAEVREFEQVAGDTLNNFGYALQF